MKQKRAVGFELRILSNLVKREIDNSTSKINESFHSDEGLTGSNGWIIGYIYHNLHKDVFQRDLEEEFQVRRSTISKILQTMESKGFIKRIPVDYDARLKKLVLTEKALKHQEVMIQTLDAIENKITKNLTEQEINDFFNIIEKMKKNLDN